jgi:hypothetical protein
MSWISPPPPADTEPSQRLFGSQPKQRRDLVRNNLHNAILLGATMGATADITLPIAFYYQRFADSIR